MEIERLTSRGDSSLNPNLGELKGPTLNGRVASTGLRRVRGLAAVAFAAILTFGSGCAGSNFWKDEPDSKVPPGIPSAPLASIAKYDPNQVAPASATTSSGPTLASLNPFTSKSDKSPKQPVGQIAIAWRNWIDYLPDPTKDGKMGPGLAGQMFAFGRGFQSVEAEGTLTIDLFDETPYPPGKPGNIPERWEFKKDALKKLRSVDERFGKCYVLFLPWPSYRPDVTRVRIVVRYDADGKTIYPEETTFNIGPKPSGSSSSVTNEILFGSQNIQQIGGFSGLGDGSRTSYGMGSLMPNGSNPSGMYSMQAPLGIIGTTPTGVPASNRPVSNLPGLESAMPITGAPMTNMPLSSMPGSMVIPQSPAGMNYSPSQGASGLSPAGGIPPGSSPYAPNPLAR